MSTVHEIDIFPGQAVYYGVLSEDRGYRIKSGQYLNGDENTEKVKEIVSKYWVYDMALEHVDELEKKIKKNLKHLLPKEKKAEDPEYSNYEGAINTLETAYKSWMAIKEKYQVYDIKTLVIVKSQMNHKLFRT